MTINCKGALVDLANPKVMGILNVTPNSFYDGGKFKNETEFLLQSEKMIQEGATFIDIGAYSSKPNAATISEKEELARIIPIVNAILKNFPDVLLSIDTYRSKVASICLDYGAAIINDISAGTLDEKMFEIIAKYKVPYCMMHLKGTPKTMQSLTNYEVLINDMLYYFSEKVALARSFGIHDLLIDPGFGFAKTNEQNYEILQKLEVFSVLDIPLLTGFSRKSMVYKILNTIPEEALNGTTVLNTIALMKGSKILRVHDVKEAVECVTLFNKLNDSKETT